MHAPQGILALNRHLTRLATCISLATLVHLAPASAAPPPAACSEPSGRYHGPLFDAMAQIDAGVGPRAAEALNNAHVQRMALFGRDKIDSHRGSGDRDVLELAAKLPGRIIPGVPKIFADSPGFDASILSGVASYLKPEPHRAFVGELLIVHGDKGHGASTAAGERTLDVRSPAFTALLRSAQTLQWPFMLHWEVYDWDRDWPRMHALYSQWPELTFIWPHAGFGSAAQTRAVIEANPNVMVTLSKKEQAQSALAQDKAEEIGPPLIDTCGTLEPDWYALLTEYPDRFLFATDAHKDFRWAKYEKVVKTWRRILRQLPPDIAHRIAYDNAMRIYHLSADTALDTPAPSADTD